MLSGVVVSGRRHPLHFTLGERLRRAREAAGLSARQLSLAAQLSAPTCSNIERGGRPGIDVIERLARSLAISPCALAYGVAGAALPTLTAGEPLRAADVGARLLRLREARGLTRTGLGRAADLSGTAVLNLEDARSTPTVITVEDLARALGCSPCWLAYAEGPSPIDDPDGAAAELQAVRFRPPRSPRKA